MKHLGVVLLLATLFVNIYANLIVQTEQGKVRGEYLHTNTGCKYVSFKGIPFAKPPVGDLRFRAPQPAECWNGVRNATKHGPVCVQISIYNGVDISGDEDCLYLNVYVPMNANSKHPLPVMFFIHGGGYQSGSGNSDRYGPDYLINQNVILVTSNHRLGALGFLKLNNGEVPGNAGIKDQVAALRWVNKNIANFGGDPSKVTIFGQSTGAASVGLHNLSPMSKGLFQRSMQMSGSPLTDWSVPFEPKRIAFRLAQQLGFYTREDKELLKFLKSVPAVKLLGTNPAILRAEDPKITLRELTFVPDLEEDCGQERFMTVHPAEALRNGMVHNVDLLIGHTSIEGIVRFIFGTSDVPAQYTNYTEMLLPRGILENIPPSDMFCLADRVHAKYFGNKQIDNNTGKEFIKYLSDISFNYAVTKYGRYFSKYQKTFMFKFTKQPTAFPRYLNGQNEFGTTGAMHEDDLLYVFSSDNRTVAKNSDDYKVIMSLTTMYANFAKYGNPTPDNSLGVKWPKYSTLTGSYLDINKQLTVRKNLDGEAVKFWDSIYEDTELEHLN